MKVRLTLIPAMAILFAGSVFGDQADLGVVVESRQQTIVKLFGAGVGTLDSYGSGVLISEKGHVVTVWNHLVNTGFLTAVVSDGRRFNVEVVGTSLDHDIAVLKLDCEDVDVFPFVDVNRPSTMSPGQSVLAFSNVFHVATGNEPVSVVHGVIACEATLDAGLWRWQFPVKSPVYILDAITNNSGAAGGLLTSIDGAPLGLLGREIRHRGSNMWVNYAVPWSTLRPAITAILAGDRIASAESSDKDVKKVSDRRLTAEFGLTLLPGIPGRTPAFIDRVIPGSPAKASGLQRGDLVLMVDDTVVQSAENLQKELGKFRRGQRVTITVNREDNVVSTTLRVP